MGWERALHRCCDTCRGYRIARQCRNAERALKEPTAVNFETLFAELSERVAHGELQFQMWN